MKKIISLFILLSACGGGSGSNSVSENLDPNLDENTLALFGVFDFLEDSSTCYPTNINDEVLSVYIDSDLTEFEILNAEESVFLAGELNDDLVYPYDGFIDDEVADCYLRLTGPSFSHYTLVESCRSENLDCDIYWKAYIPD